ncbi:MAG: 4-hydroxy-tetrahydrodipicolinate synthase [Promethearchaeota archaeon]
MSKRKGGWLKGVMPALITPFDKKGEIKEDSLRTLVNYTLECGVTGVVPVGTTGEFVNLSIEERERVYDIVIDQVNGKVPVIIGSGDSGTREVIQLTRYGKDAGADAALVVTPYFLKPTYKEIFEHFKKVSEEVDFPIVLYNIPACTDVHIGWWTVEGLADLENIIGIKDSSGNMSFIMTLMEKVKKKIAVMCGWDEIGFPALAAGADGLILASANLIPDIWIDLYNAVKGEDYEKARNLQLKIQKLVRIVCRQGATEAVKTGLQMMGFDVGFSRKPVVTGDIFRYEDREELRLQLETLNKIRSKRISICIDSKITESMVAAIPETPDTIQDFALKVGEALAGPPSFEVAHIDLLIGKKDGPLKKACDKALSNKIMGHEPKVVLQRPLTLLIPTVSVRTEKQAAHVYEFASKGVARAVEASVKDGIVPEEILDEILLIANAFVHPTAVNEKRIYFNNYKAMRHAIRKALEERPTIDELLRLGETARHPFRYTP